MKLLTKAKTTRHSRPFGPVNPMLVDRLARQAADIAENDGAAQSEQTRSIQQDAA